jgi:uncharacterized protein YllA (UPF0747 family)
VALELIFTTVALLAVTLIASTLFYKRIRSAQAEYDASKEVVRNITFGFTRQVNRLQQNIEHVENNASTAKIAAAEALKQSVEAKQATLQGLEAVKSLSERVNGAESAVELMHKEIQKLVATPRTRIVVQPEVNAAIPLQQTSIINQLTDTELDVLKKIALLNEATAPEIKAQIGLTREHTARMLKRLYDSGFVDRTTTTMPYRYSVRKEIKDVLLQHDTLANLVAVK